MILTANWVCETMFINVQILAKVVCSRTPANDEASQVDRHKDQACFLPPGTHCWKRRSFVFTTVAGDTKEGSFVFGDS